MDKMTSRREFLKKCIQVPVGGSVVLGLAACGKDEAASLVCANENLMTASEKSMRQTLKYTETSPDPAKTCKDCAFFKPTTGPVGCGTCEMFTGKQANAGGWCVSWSAKT